MFEYLNHDNRWPRLRRLGLEIDPASGALTLRRLPGPPVPIGCVPSPAPTTADAAGIAVGPDGVVYLSDPAGDRVWRLDPRAEAARPLDCGGGRGWEVGRLDHPRGLAVQRCRNRLLIADCGNRRIQVIDPRSGQVVGVWGQTWPYSTPQPCAGLGGLDGPEQLAEDSAGGVYVVDRRKRPATGQRRRLLKLDADGQPDEAFARAVELLRHSSPEAARFEPRYVAVARWTDPGRRHEHDRLLVLGTVSHPAAKRGTDPMELWLWVLTTEGTPVLAQPCKLLGAADSGPAAPDSSAQAEVNPLAHGRRRLCGFAALGTMVFVGIGAAGTAAGFSPDREPDRVWCLELRDALESGEPRLVEPSWLPLYTGAVAALGTRGEDDHADLLIHPGPGQPVVALRRGGAYRTQGAFLAGPFSGYRDRVTPWQRVRMSGDLPAGCHVQFFTLSRNEAAFLWTPPVRPQPYRLPAWFRAEKVGDLFSRLGFGPGTEAETAGPAVVERNPLYKAGELGPRPDPRRTAPESWYAAAEGQLDFLVGNSGGSVKEPADQFWIFGLMAGDGTRSPRLVQGRLAYDEDGWLADLPAVYRRDNRGREFLGPMLALFESAFEDLTEMVDRLPGLFSPHVIAGLYGHDSTEVRWLAGALALALPPPPVPRGRAVALFADGPYWLSRRGTPSGLRRLVWLETGVEVHVDEPGVADEPWVAGEAAAGEGAALAPARPDGTVLGRDVLGQAALGDPTGRTLALAADLAHHFVIRGYAADLADADTRRAVEAAVLRAAPAHATYSVQVIEPRLRVGVQARLGIDAVVAAHRPADPFTLGPPPGPDTQLSPTPTTSPTVGEAVLGSGTTLQ